eukprot:gene9542-10547_t
MLVTAREQGICRRRVSKELKELQENPVPNIQIAVDPQDILNWYCLIYGLSDAHYLHGEYIFNIKLSPRYPFEPPDFIFLTPNGRFELQRKLCFSNSSHHKETWSPIWTIRTILLGFLSFFLENSSTGLGHLSTAVDVKRQLAAASKAYNEDHLASILEMIRSQNPPLPTSFSPPTNT